MHRVSNPRRMGWLACGVALAFVGRAPAESGADFFENRIRPVLAERCFKCHGADKKQSKGGLQLDTRDALLKGGKSGPTVIPGNPDASLLIQMIRKTEDELRMPRGDERLSPAQIQDLMAWVKMGAPYPAKSAATPALDLAEARRFWSFQPVKNPAPSVVKATTWPRGPIDSFILARLEEAGLKPSPPADPRTLLRRATYDLTGLPPTPEEMEAFLKETATAPEAAYGRAIDRLLASPQYGVRWGRHWLDVARYGDTRWVGAGEDRRWPFAYTYRDWVIAALNEDMGYDRFVTLQLAADQTPDARPTDKAALGFLTVGRWFTGVMPDIIDDQIDVVTRGLLGLSAQCARCHDHKFDPISGKDYYSLYGLFAAARMPVEGTGMLAELPEVGARPIDAGAEKEITRLRDELDKYLRERLDAVRNQFNSPEKLAEYLLAAQTVATKTDNEVRAIAKSQGLNEQMLLGWVRLLQRSIKNLHPIFGAWHAFAALPEAEFAAKAAEVAEQARANKKTNRLVAALLSAPPASLQELAMRYARLLAKFDAPAPSSDPDQEMVRQALRNNDSPLPASPGQAAQYMTMEERDQAVQMRRALLARLSSLSEAADQYLAAQHEAAAALAEVNDFFQRRRAEVAAEIRSADKIAEYLVAAREARNADELRFKAIVKTRKLSDVLLRRWVEFLKRQAERDDPVFTAWRAYATLTDAEFLDRAAAVTAQIAQAPRQRLVIQAFSAAPKSLQDAAARYAELIVKYSKPEPAADPDEEGLRQVSTASDSPLAFELDEVLNYFTRKDVDELRNKENKLARFCLDHPGSAPRAMMLRESPRGYAQKVFVRGNPSVPGEDAPGGFLSVLAGADHPPFHKGKGRWELARAIVDPANPLTARVMVNRVWQWHFGKGLIATPSDLGVRARSSQPSGIARLDRAPLHPGRLVAQDTPSRDHAVLNVSAVIGIASKSAIRNPQSAIGRCGQPAAWPHESAAAELRGTSRLIAVRRRAARRFRGRAAGRLDPGGAGAEDHLWSGGPYCSSRILPLLRLSQRRCSHARTARDNDAAASSLPDE